MASFALPFKDARGASLRHVGFVLLLATLLLFGGASRADALSQIAVRLVSIVAIFLVAIHASPQDLRLARLPLIFLAILAVVISWQLIPLPFDLWASLSGRAPWAQALQGADITNWRPASLSPDATLNSLVALLPMFAVAVVGASAGASGLKSALPVILGALALSALLSIVQVGSGGAYFYAITNRFEAVGLFANRNHQAFFLACCLPLLACWVGLAPAKPSAARLRGWIAICASAGIYPLCLITGSRTGLALAGLGTLLALAVWLPTRRSRRSTSPAARLVMIAPVLIGVVAIAATIFMSRDEALVRLAESHVDEIRLNLLPTYLRMAGDFFPFGAGFGTFDPVFRYYEPNQYLSPQYLNQAHNDWLQIVIEGGLPAAALLLTFGAILANRVWLVWRGSPRSDSVLLGRAGSVVIVLLIAASATDYPLRTPALASLFVLAILWIFAGAARENERRGKGLAASAE